MRIIIDFPDDMKHTLALNYVTAAVGDGKRLSKARGHDKFCHVTTFGDSTYVYARDRRSEDAADSFYILTGRNPK